MQANFVSSSTWTEMALVRWTSWTSTQRRACSLGLAHRALRGKRPSWTSPASRLSRLSVCAARHGRVTSQLTTSDSKEWPPLGLLHRLRLPRRPRRPRCRRRLRLHRRRRPRCRPCRRCRRCLRHRPCWPRCRCRRCRPCRRCLRRWPRRPRCRRCRRRPSRRLQRARPTSSWPRAASRQARRALNAAFAPAAGRGFARPGTTTLTGQ
mmetsp:Transcript_1042/g.3727  ORF Transcript_1042/g.3727 Transcript_1042/m.3727 type:complete len:208 (-) Transcript_1042:484-1107(-)